MRCRLKDDLDLVRSKRSDNAQLVASAMYLNFPQRLEDYKNYLSVLESKWLDTLRRRGWNSSLDYDNAVHSSTHVCFLNTNGLHYWVALQ